MSLISALAAATITAPADAAIPPGLETALRNASDGSWRAIEIVLAGDVLRGRLGKTRDPLVRDGVLGVLGLFSSTPLKPEALAALRDARSAGIFDGAIDVNAIRTTRADVREALADHPDLVLDADLTSLLVDAARASFREAAKDPALAVWAAPPTGIEARDRALTAFARLIASPKSVDELEKLIAMPIHLDENVQFTVYRPRTIDPGRWHPMLAFAHLSERRADESVDPVAEVAEQAAAVLGSRAKDFQPVTQDSGSAIPAEGELTFVPEIEGIDFNPPRRSFVWLEPVHREEFRMRAGDALKGKTVRGRMTVFLGHIVIAEVGLSVRVDDAVAPDTTAREPSRARTYRKIFASYSHRDVDIVNQFETYARALGDEYLRDWIHLRTGEVWNDRLRELIEGADAFQLFWSRNAMGSKFVKQEYEHALSLNRPSFVRPTYWEEPMPTAPGLPPEALLRLHFQKIGGAALARPAAAPAARARAAAPMQMPAPAPPAPAPPAPAPARKEMDLEAPSEEEDAFAEVAREIPAPAVAAEPMPVEEAKLASPSPAAMSSLSPPDALKKRKSEPPPKAESASSRGLVFAFVAIAIVALVIYFATR